MDHDQHAPFHPGVAQKADAVFGAIASGHRRIGAIAQATLLPETTVIRVAGLLRARGRIGVERTDGIALVPATAS
jgi:hypothetical protein